MEFILEHRSGVGCSLVNQTDSFGATPAHYAAMLGNEKILDVLVSKVRLVTYMYSMDYIVVLLEYALRLRVLFTTSFYYGY